jgi:16S rRNA processing protein RimM
VSRIERLEVGWIGKPHGLRGELLVRLTTDRTQRVDPGSELATDDSVLVVHSSRPHQNGYLVVFEGVSTREHAEALRGSQLYADPIDDPDTIWVHDLVGLAIVEADGTPRGTVVEVEANPASDLLVTADGHLIPLAFMVECDTEQIVIDPPPGLFDSA